MEKRKRRDILLCDLDAFFAAVEQRDNPLYRGKPLIVGGLGARGVVSTCSYEARKFGVRSAMPMRRARELCPQAIFLAGDMRRYQEASMRVMSILERFTPEVEPVSIDEAYLALPAGKGLDAAAEIKRLVREEVQLPLTVGVSENKLLAKVACELAKPDGIGSLWPREVEERLWPLSVRTLPGVGPATEKKLQEVGIVTVGDLAKAPPKLLENLLGTFAGTLHGFARGRDERDLATSRQAKSISEETTFPSDISDESYLLAVMMELAEGVGRSLRSDGWKARTISLKLRFADFKTITRDATLPDPTDRDSVIYRVVKDLFYRYKGSPPWRLVGVRAAGLEKAVQLSLLDPGQDENREKNVGRVQDELHRKFGREVLYRARRLRPRDKE